MKQRLSKLVCILALSLSSCQVGLGPGGLSQSSLNTKITPRTKGPTLEITPRTKGSTLLNGSIVWPTDLQPPQALIFNVRALSEDLEISVQSNEQGFFTLSIPDSARSQMLRLEAQAQFDAELVLKQVIQVPESARSAQIEIEISLESTAFTAVIDYLKTLNSPVSELSMERLKQPEMMRQIKIVEMSMKPFLATNMQQNLESMPPVQEALKQSRQSLENMQNIQAPQTRADGQSES